MRHSGFEVVGGTATAIAALAVVTYVLICFRDTESLGIRSGSPPVLLLRE